MVEAFSCLSRKPDLLVRRKGLGEEAEERTLYHSSKVYIAGYVVLHSFIPYEELSYGKRAKESVSDIESGRFGHTPASESQSERAKEAH